MAAAAPAYQPAQYTPLDAGQLVSISPADANALAISADEAFYAAADTDFHTRRQELWEGNRAAEAQLLREINGDFEPGVQAGLVRTGLGSALAMMGGSGGVPPGSIGSFAVARGLGLNFLLLQQQAGRELRALNAATPKRRIGISGQMAVQFLIGQDATFNEVTIGNFQGRNEFNLSNAAGQYKRDLFTYLTTPQQESFWHRIFNGSITYALEGYKYGGYAGPIAALYGAAGGFLIGAADGALNGYGYQAHQANNALTLGSTGFNGLTYANSITYG